MCPYIPDQQINTGSYVQQSPVFDVSRFYSVEIGSPEFKELMVRLGEQINNVSIVLNNKESSLYLTEQFVNGNLFFNTTSSNQLDLRSNFRLVINNAIPVGVTAINHNLPITNTWSFTKISGVASDTVGFNYYPLPFASAGGATNIEIRVTATQVIVTNNSGINFDIGIIILEFLKN